MLDNSAPPSMSLVPFQLLPPCWSSEGVSPSKSMHRSLKRNCLRLLKTSTSLSLIPCRFLQAEVRGNSLRIGTWGWGPGVGLGSPHSSGGPSAAEMSFSIFIYYTWVWDQLVLCLHPSYKYWCDFFFHSLVVGLPFSQISGTSEWLLFCSLALILMWLWEDVSSTFTYAAILTGSLLWYSFVIPLLCSSLFHCPTLSQSNHWYASYHCRFIYIFDNYIWVKLEHVFFICVVPFTQHNYMEIHLFLFVCIFCYMDIQFAYPINRHLNCL